MTTLKAGKLPNSILAELLRDINVERKDPRLLVGPSVGEDAAHIDFGPNTLIAKSDPITFATDDIGWYAVNINANDIATTGGTPKWFLATLLMPLHSTAEQVSTIFQQLRTAANEINVTLAGGHTEVTPAVTQPVICGFMLGEATTGKTVSTSGAQPGDSIILTKGIAIEGTAILAREATDQLAECGIDSETIRRAANLLKTPGISVLADAQQLMASGGIHAMHDVTEGGVATAITEMATAADLDIHIRPQNVDVLPETTTICNTMNIDPWGLISSGAMLAAVTPERAPNALEMLHDAGIKAEVIGKAHSPADSTDPAVLILHDDGILTSIRTFERDELARHFESST